MKIEILVRKVEEGESTFPFATLPLHSSLALEMEKAWVVEDERK
jgi:hypothetical protein